MAHGNGSSTFAQHVGHIITHSGAGARNATTFSLIDIAGHAALEEPDRVIP
jgi:hypothetical protein